MNSKNEDDIYRKLQIYLDSLPIDYPETESGVELRILKHQFTPQEAEIVLNLKIIPQESVSILNLKYLKIFYSLHFILFFHNHTN